MTKELDKIRAEIDKIDGELYRGLERRLGLVRSLAGLKRTQGREDTRQRENLFRPAREASLIGKLLKRGRVAPSLIVYIWRQIISASLNLQQAHRFGLWAKSHQAAALASAAAWAGGGSSIEIFSTPKALFTALLDVRVNSRRGAMIGFVPCDSPATLWQKMPEGIYVVARWSYLKKDKAFPLYILARLTPEETGDDRALVLKNKKLIIKRGFMTKEQVKKDEKFLGCFAAPIDVN